MLDLVNFHFIQVDVVAEGGFLLIIHIWFRKFLWISWISILDSPSEQLKFETGYIAQFRSYDNCMWKTLQNLL